jgi:hypothetical protein
LRESLPLKKPDKNFLKENRVNILSGLTDGSSALPSIKQSQFFERTMSKTRGNSKLDGQITPAIFQKIHSLSVSKKNIEKLKEESSPIRVKRNKFIEETKREQQNSSLNFQYKNISPRLA